MRIVPNDVSLGEVAKLVCADNRRRAAPYDARDTHVRRVTRARVCRTRGRLEPRV